MFIVIFKANEDAVASYMPPSLIDRNVRHLLQYVSDSWTICMNALNIIESECN